MPTKDYWPSPLPTKQWPKWRAAFWAPWRLLPKVIFKAMLGLWPVKFFATAAWLMRGFNPEVKLCSTTFCITMPNFILRPLIGSTTVCSRHFPKTSNSAVILKWVWKLVCCSLRPLTDLLIRPAETKKLPSYWWPLPWAKPKKINLGTSLLISIKSHGWLFKKTTLLI